MQAQRHIESLPFAYSEELIHEIADEIMPVIENHYLEVARNQDTVPLSVDWEKYRVLTENGICSTVTARENGKLIGYIVNFVSPHLHHKQNVLSVNDVIYLDPGYRGKGLADGMMGFCEALLRDKYGVEVMHMTMKLAHDFTPLMQRRGYVAIETIWEKKLWA